MFKTNDSPSEFPYVLWGILIGQLAVGLFFLSLSMPAEPPFPILSAVAGIVAGMSAAAAVGIIMRKQWGRILTMVILGVGVLVGVAIPVVELVLLGTVIAPVPRLGLALLSGVFLFVFARRAEAFK